MPNNSEDNPSNSIFLALSEYLSKHKKGINRASETARKFYANEYFIMNEKQIQNS